MLRDLVVEEYILERPSGILRTNAQMQDLKMAAKRYSHKGADGAVDYGLTLVFCHGLGARMFHRSFFTPFQLSEECLTQTRSSGNQRWHPCFIWRALKIESVLRSEKCGPSTGRAMAILASSIARNWPLNVRQYVRMQSWYSEWNCWNKICISIVWLGCGSDRIYRLSEDVGS